MIFFSRVVSLTNYDKYYYFFILGIFFSMKIFLSGEFCRHLYVYLKCDCLLVALWENLTGEQ